LPISAKGIILFEWVGINRKFQIKVRKVNKSKNTHDRRIIIGQKTGETLKKTAVYPAIIPWQGSPVCPPKRVSAGSLGCKPDRENRAQKPAFSVIVT
jgi:hypothetical protein